MPPLITIGIPAYNRPALLAEALQGILAQTAGTSDYEVLVCDDGSDPETAATVARFPADRFLYRRNPVRLGPVGNWNACLLGARGRWVTILHEDDVLYPWYLETLLPRLREGVAALCVRTVSGETTVPLTQPAGVAAEAARAYPPRFFVKSSMTPFPGVLFPRELGVRLGGFDENAAGLADYDFWYRLSKAGRIEVVPVVAAFYRVSGEQWTASAWPAMIRQTHLLRLRIAREQIASHRMGRWLARFFTYRNALSYARRFTARPPSLTRALKLKKIPFHFLPSGWVWAWLRMHR